MAAEAPKSPRLKAIVLDGVDVLASEKNVEESVSMILLALLLPLIDNLGSLIETTAGEVGLNQDEEVSHSCSHLKI